MSSPIFTQKFDGYVCPEDTIETEHKGIRYVARIERDSDTHIDDDDTHNTDQSVTGCDDEQQAKLLEARQAWFDDEWFYCSVVIAAYVDGLALDDYATSLWAIEANYPNSDNAYLTEVANELLVEAVETAKMRAKGLRAELDKLV